MVLSKTEKFKNVAPYSHNLRKPIREKLQKKFSKNQNHESSCFSKIMLYAGLKIWEDTIIDVLSRYERYCILFSTRRLNASLFH
jgi:hypothetical protein